MTAKPPSIVRIVWGEATTAEGLTGVLPALALSVAFLVWRPFGAGYPERIAPNIGAVALIWGLYLFSLAGGIGRRVTLDSLKQLRSEPSDTVWLRLMGRIGARAAQKARAATISEPRSAVIAAPVFAALGAACLGFTAAMLFAAPSHGVLPRPDAGLWLAAIFFAILLLTGLYRASRTTRVLYLWAGEQAAEVAEAQADAERARLTALQAQMNPAFLFNTLDTVITLARSDTARAERVVERLSGVLRRGLKRSAESMTSVNEEVQFIREYLDIERERLGTRLNVAFALDPDAAGAPVPTGCLQPLVENSVKFAVSRQPEGGHIRIAAERAGDNVRLTVEDDGPKFSPDRLDANGIGGLRERLRAVYGDAAEIYTGTPFMGARVMMTIPARDHDGERA